jgi:hypothetical protein
MQITLLQISAVLLSGFLAQTVPPEPRPKPKPPLTISVGELPPEKIPPGTCKESYSGYLEIDEHGRTKDTNLGDQEIGGYVKKRLGEGYSLALYPQASGRLFVIETCHTENSSAAPSH